MTTNTWKARARKNNSNARARLVARDKFLAKIVRENGAPLTATLDPNQAESGEWVILLEGGKEVCAAIIDNDYYFPSVVFFDNGKAFCLDRLSEIPAEFI